jgi:hypothetical protein
MKNERDQKEGARPDRGDAMADPPEGVEVYKGLCANCEKRQTCTLQRPEGGVWHCDEYE